MHVFLAAHRHGIRPTGRQAGHRSRKATASASGRSSAAGVVVTYSGAHSSRMKGNGELARRRCQNGHCKASAVASALFLPCGQFIMVPVEHSKQAMIGNRMAACSYYGEMDMKGERENRVADEERMQMRKRAVMGSFVGARHRRRGRAKSAQVIGWRAIRTTFGSACTGRRRRAVERA